MRLLLLSLLSVLVLGLAYGSGCAGSPTPPPATTPTTPTPPPGPVPPPPPSPNPPSTYPEPVFNILSYGAVAGTDCTSSIQSAMNAAAGTGGTVLIPDGTYKIDALTRLRPQSNSTIHLEPNAILEALPNNQTGYAIVYVIEASDVTIQGGTIKGERDSHTGSGGEWGMGISIINSQNITVRNITTRDCWGDGFYVGDNSTNLTFTNVVADRNRRQGMSIVCGNNINITNSTFKNTYGTLPEAGIDLEPNVGEEVRNVQVSNCTFENNAGNGFQTGVPIANSGVAFTSNVTLENCTLTGNGKTSLDGKVAGLSISNMETATVNNCTITDSGENGITVYGQSHDTHITNNHITNNGKNGIELYRVSSGMVTGNTITGNVGYGIWEDTVSGYTIESNTISDNGM